MTRPAARSSRVRPGRFGSGRTGLPGCKASTTEGQSPNQGCGPHPWNSHTVREFHRKRAVPQHFNPRSRGALVVPGPLASNSQKSLLNSLNSVPPLLAHLQPWKILAFFSSSLPPQPQYEGRQSHSRTPVWSQWLETRASSSPGPCTWTQSGQWLPYPWCTCGTGEPEVPEKGQGQGERRRPAQPRACQAGRGEGRVGNRGQREPRICGRSRARSHCPLCCVTVARALRTP